MKNRKGTHMRAARICSSESSPNFCWFINYFGVPHGVTRKQVMNLFIFFSRKNNEMENTTIHCLPRTTFLFQNFIGKFFCDPRNLKNSSFLCLRKTINKADL